MFLKILYLLLKAIANPKRFFFIRRINKKNKSAIAYNASVDIVGKLDILEGCNLDSGVIVTVPKNARLSLGIGVHIGKESEIGVGRLITIGNHTSIQVRSILLGNIRIGRGCVFAPNLYMSSGIHHFRDVPELPIKIQDIRAREFVDAESDVDIKSITIGDDCWLGINVVVMPGVTIGKGCVVGANSVVTSDLPPYSIAVGAPARVIKKRLNFVTL